MKTLKKVLSLVLVVAMIASMLIVGAAAAAEETKYDEAVAVVTGLGIIEGDENGMNFTGNLTREQAAKIIAYMLLGKDTAEALKTSAAPFADVAATRWSAGYIAYLKGQGIISGVSDTEFDPTAKVTGVALAKMLLTAVGYGANGEFEGSAWDINTITFANQNNIFNGTLATDVAAAATREEAMLYLFNALQVPTVSYNKTFESYYVGNSALTPVVDDPATEENEQAPYTLGWKNYALALTAGEGTDDFGRPSASWVADGVILVEDVACEKPDAVLYGKVTSGTLYTTLGKAASEALNATMVEVEDEGYYTNENITVIVDGVVADDNFQLIKSGYLTGAISGNGATVELYLDYAVVEGVGTYTLTAVVYYEYFGQVQKINTTDNVLTIRGVGDVDGEVVDITGFAKNDYVIYTKGETAIHSLRAAEATVGTYTGTDYNSMYLVNGVAYKINEKADVDLDIDVTYEFYFDAQGNIIFAELYDAEAVAGTYQYVYVSMVEAETANYSLLEGGAAKVVMYVAYANGGAGVVNYAVKYNSARGYYYITLDGANYELNAANVAAINEGTALTSIDGEETATLYGWMSFNANEDGALTLKNIGEENLFATLVDGYVATPNSPITGTAFNANSKTVLTIVDSLGNATVYNGIANFPILDTTATEGPDGVADTADDIYYSTVITHAKGGSTAKTITVYTTDAAPAAPVYAYVVMSWGTSAAGTTYFAYVDGIPQFITVSADNNHLTFGMFEVAVWTVSGGENELASAWATNTWTFNMDMNTYATTYLESATIGEIDDNFFKTVAVDAEDWADSEMGKNAATAAMGSYDGDIYYYDANTIIYDCVNGGIATELTEGANFLAVTSATASTIYADAHYCTHIWIVG